MPAVERGRHPALLQATWLYATSSLPAVAGSPGDPERPANIIFEITANPYGGTGISAGEFGHPTGLNTNGSATLPAVPK